MADPSVSRENLSVMETGADTYGVCVCVRAHVRVCTCACVKATHASYHMDPRRDQTQVLRLSGNHLDPLSHLASPKVDLLFLSFII